MLYFLSSPPTASIIIIILYQSALGLRTQDFRSFGLHTP